jgi:Ca-activated chloride channel homolog
MRLRVAFLLVLTVFGSAAVAQRQPQRQKSAVGKPPGETIRICQGLPIPDGYVIIAYMTSSACAHGAYLLRRQADYESSLPVNGTRPRTDESAAAPKPSTNPPKTAAQPPRNSPRTTRKSAPGAGTSADSGPSPSRTVGNSTSSQSATVTRPRRVGGPEPATPTSSGASTGPVADPATSSAADPAEDTPAGPPTLIGSQTARAVRPPTLMNAGAANSNTPATDLSSVNTTADAGPEEVDEGDVVRVDTNLVTVPVSVLDKQGRFVPNLRREDFTLLENNVEQAIAYFEPSEKPFTVALVLDTSASTHFHLWEIKEAAIAFAKQLRPQDRVLVVSFNDQVLLLTEATNDLGIVETVIEENATTGNSTRLYDAVDLTIRERLNKIKGRKAIVLFTDGVDTSSQQATLQSTLREVEELDALIYPIKYDTSDYLRAMQGNGSITVTTTTRGLFGTNTSTQTYNVPGSGATIPGSTKADYDRADQYLHALADRTGGRLYEANNTKQLADAFSRIAEELRRQYSLGYYPKSDSADASERRDIRVRVRQQNLAVKARASYLKSLPPNPDNR